MGPDDRASDRHSTLHLSFKPRLILLVVFALLLTFKKIVRKGLFRKKEVEEPVVLTLVGGNEAGEVEVSPFGDTNIPQDIGSFSKADETIRDFFDTAAQEPVFPVGL